MSRNALDTEVIVSRYRGSVAARWAGSVLVVAAAVALGCAGAKSPTEAGENTTPAPVAGQVLALGTLRATNIADPTCPPGSLCRSVEISCSGVAEPIRAFISVANPVGNPRGVVVFTTGSGGETWALIRGERTDLLEQLRTDGFIVVQVRWATNWLVSSQGNDAGTARLACRPATAFNWIHETYFQPLRIARSAGGRCGFCITGNSGGATQVSYALSHYGLETILDGVVPTGGPPHAALAKACLLKPGEEDYWFADGTRDFIDRAFGFFDGNGPCARHDAAFTSRWNQESVATGGSDYSHPQTRVHFILGDLDINMRAPNSDYLARLRAAGSPWLTLQMAPATPHAVLGTDAGRDNVRAAFLATR